MSIAFGETPLLMQEGKTLVHIPWFLDLGFYKKGISLVRDLYNKESRDWIQQV